MDNVWLDDEVMCPSCEHIMFAADLIGVRHAPSSNIVSVSITGYMGDCSMCGEGVFEEDLLDIYG